MIHVFNTALGICIGVSVAMLVYWGTGLVRLISMSRSIPTAAAGLRLRPSDEQVCIVVPAHNEAANIGPLIRSLRAQDHHAWRAVLVLDRCTDETFDVARDAIGDDDRFEILQVEHCPHDWAGKVNAMWHGVQTSKHAATCDVLLFIDADMLLAASSLRATLALRRERGLDLLSLVPHVRSRSWWEWVAQPAAGLELLRQYPLQRANRAGFGRPFVSGQFIMFERGVYERIGGHRAVHDEMLEDLAIGRLGADLGLRIGAFLSGGLVTCHMYPSWQAFKNGWSRIFAESSRRRVGRLGRAGWQVRAFGTVLPLLTLALLGVTVLSIGTVVTPLWIIAGAFAIVALAGFVATLAGAFRVAGLPWRSVVAYPFGAWLVGEVLFEAAGKIRRCETTTWAGREYRLAPR